MLTVDFVNKIIFSPTVTSLKLRRVVLQRTTGKMTGVKWWSFFPALRLCDVKVLPCLVEIVTFNTIPQCTVCFVVFFIVHSVHLGRVVCDRGS